MVSKRLSKNATMGQLHTQARQLLVDIRSGDPSSCKRIVRHPDYLYKKLSPSEVKGLEFTLRDARLIVAREYRQKTWTDLEETVRRIRRLGTTAVQEAILEDRMGDLRNMLTGHADLVHEPLEWLTRWNRIQTGSLLSFAREKGSVASMHAVVEAGADLNRTVNDGWNCDVLHGCLQTSTRKPAEHLHACINLLIDAGAPE